MNQQDLPRGEAPKGSFYNAGSIDHDFFNASSAVARDQSLITHMPFLHVILYSKIETAIVARDRLCKKKDTSRSKSEQSETQKDSVIDGDSNGLDSMRRKLPASSVEDMEGVSHSETMSSVDVEQKQLFQGRVSMSSVVPNHCGFVELNVRWKYQCRFL